MRLIQEVLRYSFWGCHWIMKWYIRHVELILCCRISLYWNAILHRIRHLKLIYPCVDFVFHTYISICSRWKCAPTKYTECISNPWLVDAWSSPCALHQTVRCQVITWTNNDLCVNCSLGKYFSEFVKIKHCRFNQCMLPAKWAFSYFQGWTCRM